jgi:hypothetical protein
MKEEELLARSQEEERDYGPPYFECSCSSQDDPTEYTMYKLQTAQDVIKLFPWARELVLGSQRNFYLQLIDDYEVVKISRVA